VSSAQLEKFNLVKPAEIEWQNGLPFSTEFNDVYFSVHGAVEESQHVFIEGNRLVEDWNNKEQNQFVVAELGFGSSLNFLNTANQWILQQEQTASHLLKNKHLHYIAIEKRPFSIADYKKMVERWPQFSHISQALINHYPSLTYGRHQITFSQWDLTLTLILMPIDHALDDLVKESESQQNKIKVDHWFLDGFAPTKNTSMWRDENAKKIAAISKPGTRLATYSVARSVKQPLKDVGFKINKRKGFAKKREMLTAVFEQSDEDQNKVQEQTQSTYINIKYEKPWFNLSQTTSFSPSGKQQAKVAIIGTGIAGSSTAYTLSKLGFQCDLYDKNKNIAEGASGAAAGIFHPQLTSDMNESSQFNWLAYMTLLRFLSELTEQEKKDVILSQGVDRFVENELVTDKLLKLSEQLNFQQWIKESNNFPSDRCAISFPHSAIIDMKMFCRLLLKKIPKEQLIITTDCEILDVNKEDNHWIVQSKNQTQLQTKKYSHVIFCGGANSKLLEKFDITSTHITRGQTCLFESQKLSVKIRHALCEQVYLVPRDNHQFQLGTTFESFIDNQLNSSSQIDMLTRTSSFLKSIGLPYLSPNEINSIPLKGTLGYRLHANDRLPLVGGVPDTKKLSIDFSNLGQKRIRREEISHYNTAGLWINTAYGSHGLLYSLIASQHLASLITNQISPLENTLANRLHPARFFVKELKASVKI